MLAAWGRRDGIRAKGIQEEEKERCCKKHMRDELDQLGTMMRCKMGLIVKAESIVWWKMDEG